jgi:hypothetical protein
VKNDQLHMPFNTPLFANSEPIARTSDPVTSAIAAKEITASGLRDSQKAAVLAWLGRAPRCTSAELARLSGMDRHLVARRLPDLEADGFVRKNGARACSVSGRLAVLWETV